MKRITLFLTIVFTICLAANTFAQKPDEVLATAAGRSFTAKDLTPETQRIWLHQTEERTHILSDMIAETLLETEAKATATTAEKMLGAAKAKIPAPTEAAVAAVYENNRQVFGEKTLAEVKPQIVAFLRREPEQKAVQGLIDNLRTKYKVAFGKDVNAADLKPLDMIVTIGGKAVQAQEFEEKNKLALTDARANAYDRAMFDLREAMYAHLLATEASDLKIEPGDIIAREITDKLRDYSDEERDALQTALEKRLFAKYKVSFAIKEPPPIVQNVSADDDPSIGKPSAPVTIVMFSDFQCPACAATHPVLKKVIAEYADRVRFVVRDFPLETVHENAFQAALAAKAAFNQGKFFEYSEKLYANQNALDTASLKRYASELGLNPKQFEIDLTDEKTAAEVRKDQADGKSYGIAGTPSVFVNGVKVRVLSAAVFRQAIEKELKK